MSRDFKPARQPPVATSRSRGGTLFGIFIGLVLGVGAALGVVWYMNKAPVPFVANKTGSAAESARQGSSNGPVSPVPLPGKPGDPPVEKRFQFYDILPGKSEPKPDGKPEAASHAPAKPTPAETAAKPAEAPKPANADIHLQAGSFQNSKDADNLKATLALSGHEAGVQQVMVGDKVWYRVRLGPYAKSDEAGKVKAELSKLGIEASVVKGKD